MATKRKVSKGGRPRLNPENATRVSIDLEPDLNIEARSLCPRMGMNLSQLINSILASELPKLAQRYARKTAEAR